MTQIAPKVSVDEAHSLWSFDSNVVLPDRKTALNNFLFLNHSSIRMENRLQLPIDGYKSDRQVYTAMQLLAASFYSVINTVAAVKGDLGKVWRHFIDSQTMERNYEIFREPDCMDSLLVDVIRAYNNAISRKERIQILTLVGFIYNF